MWSPFYMYYDLYAITSAGAAVPIGPVLTRQLLAPFYVIYIRVVFSTGKVFPVGQVQPDHYKFGGGCPEILSMPLNTVSILHYTAE